MISFETVPKKNIAFRKRSIIGRDLVLGENICVELNEIALLIWNEINGDNSIDDIVETITEEYDADKETIQSDVIEFVEDLCKNKIIYEVEYA